MLRARKAMKPLAPGDVIEIEATDPSSVQDFKSFCETTGHILLAHSAAEGVYSFQIRKAG